MTDQIDTRLKEPELSLRQQEIELERAKLFIAFARYGFAGTLGGSMGGLAVVVILAAMNAFTTSKIETWGLVAIAAIVLVGSVAFGFFSLWELPRIVARFQKTQVSINPTDRTK